MNEAEEFDMEKHELEMLNKVLDPVGSVFMDGRFYQEGDEEGTSLI